MSSETRGRRRPEPLCPVRVGEHCTLCVPGATGPHDCGLVYLVMDDDELREALAENRREQREASRGTGNHSA